MDNQIWKVKRWSGRDMDQVRTVFQGSEADALAKFEAIEMKMRQGFVQLRNPTGEKVKQTTAWRNRTRW